jgi:anti-sigma factor RsiW
MRCEDLLKAMNDYVDGEIAPAVCEEFEQHLAGCNPCQVVVDTIRGTIHLYRAGEPYEMPEGFRDGLRQVLRRRWKTRYGGGQGSAS